jgi:glycosyltransferase involved in cell wall biosynthesis
MNMLDASMLLPPQTGTADSSGTLQIGILNPDWTVLRHNTDHVCVTDFAAMGQWEPGLQLRFVGTGVQYLKANMNTATQRLWRKSFFPSIALRQEQLHCHALYRYGPDAQGMSVDGTSHPPMLSTGGFPGLRQVIEQGASFMQEQANHLDRKMQGASIIHFHTDSMREQYLALRPAQASRCITIPFFLPQLEFLTSAQVREKFDQPETVLLFVGADGQRKGLEELCAALDLMADSLDHNKVRVVIVSKYKPSCHRFKNIRHEKKLSRGEVQVLMRQAHAYCMVPRYESFGLVFVEAMAAGCAVLADDDLPRQEILDNGRCGVLLPARQPAAIARALSDLLDDRARMCALALAGLARARTRYAPAAVSRAYAQAFARLVA